MGFVEALQLVFIVLKVLGMIDWSWWWVLSPLLFCIPLYAAIAAVVVFGRHTFLVPRFMRRAR